MTIISGNLLEPASAAFCGVRSRAIVRIDADGRIADVEEGSTKAADVLGGEERWIVPGFVDAHLHLPQWDRRGIDGYPLREWFENVIYPAEARFVDAALGERLAEEFVTGLIANGTTTVAAFGSPFAEAADRAFAVFARRGIRAVFGKMLNDMNCPAPLREDADKALDEARSLAARWHASEGGRLLYAFSPRTPVCCSEKLMRGAAALARMLGCPIQTHVAESRSELVAARESFPDRIDEIDLLAEMGLLTPQTLLGHGVFLNRPQRNQVARAGSAVVHCPTANLFLEAGIMDYAACRSAGIRVALGSSVAGGPDPFMPHVAVQCLQTAKGLRAHAIPPASDTVPTPAEAWWLLTKGGAEALNLAERIGAIAPGYEADLLVVRPEPWIGRLPPEQQVSALLYTIRPDQIEHVFVAGRRVGP